MTITRKIRTKLEEIRKKITKDTSNKMNFGEVINHLINFYNKHSESEGVPMIVPVPSLVVSGRSIIAPKKKEVIDQW